MKKIAILFILSIITINAFTQEVGPTLYPNKSFKGKFYIFWGWNRGYFTDSDIRFKGNNYDFTLFNVVAKDRQTPFGIDPYFTLNKISIPQTNCKIGYFFSKHYDISLGVDHMKYVMQQNQTVKISGYISNSGTVYDGTYNNDDLYITRSFLAFEHTNGLNYINTELDRFDNIINLKKLTHLNIDINTTIGVGAGALLPRTDATLLNYKRNDQFHLAGFGLDAKAGLNITFFKYFFLQSEIKAGYINMPDIRTTEFTTDKAQQHFEFIQTNFLVGVIFPLIKQKS